MPICFQTFVIYWIEKDSDQAGTESWKRTNNLKSPSPLHPLRGAKIAAKVIEDVHVVAARVPKVTRFATSLGTENVKKEKTVLISMSKTPSQDLVPPKRRGRARVSPLQRCQGRNGQNPVHLLPTGQMSSSCGGKCFYKHENAAAPTKDPKRTNSRAPKKKVSG